MKDFYFYTEGLSVGYDGVPLIKDIKIEVDRGEILTLIGPNGAGKTTVLRSIMKQLRPVSGMVYLDKEDMKGISAKELSKKMSVVLTGRVKTELMTCEDVVATGRYPYTGPFGVLSKDDREIVRESMEMVHVSDLADRDFTRISDGQKQRVMLARAICQEPEIILLDEPTSFLDIKYKLEFLSVLQRMSAAKNLTVIMSLHELDLAQRISDKIMCIKGDKVDKFGTPEEIFNPGYISGLYAMTAGSYDEVSGNVELEKAEGAPRVFVIAGCGKGTAVFRRLQREGTPFAAGILWENDLDFPSAKALAAEVVSEKAYCAAGRRSVERCKEIISGCDRVICAVDIDTKRDYAGELAELYEFSLKLGKLGNSENPKKPENPEKSKTSEGEQDGE